MGYTHYWRKIDHPDFTEIDRVREERAYALALAEIAEVVRHSPVELAGGDGQGQPRLTGRIWLNGCGKDSCETFYLPTTIDEVEPFSFCKTRGKPYDLVVTAALTILANRCLSIVVSSDGAAEDFDAGVGLAQDVLKRRLLNPMGLLAVLQGLAEVDPL